MLGHTLDVAIGLSYTFLLLSLFCSAIREGLASAFQTRAKILLDGVLYLLHEGKHRKQGWQRAISPFRQLFRLDDAFKLTAMPEEALSRAVLRHPLVTALMQEGRMPSYIPSTIFSRALIDVLLHRCPQATASAAPGAALLATLQNADLARAIRAMVGEGAVDLATFEKALQQCYESTMERVTGWYKRRSQLVLFIIGVCIAGTMNIDTIELAKRLWANPEEAHALADRIDMNKLQELVDKAGQTGFPQLEQLEAFKQQNESIISFVAGLRTLPVGWQTHTLMCPAKSSPTKGTCGWDLVFFFPGWFIAALAASLGAPFWFDGLGKMLALRGSGAPQGTSTSNAPQAPPSLPEYSQLPPPSPAPTQFEKEELSHDERVLIQQKLGLTGQSLNGQLDQVTRDLIKAVQIQQQEVPSGILTPSLVKKILDI